MGDLDMGYREHPAKLNRRRRRRVKSQLAFGGKSKACTRCGGAYRQQKKAEDGYCSDSCRFAARIEGGSRMVETDTDKTRRQNMFENRDPDEKTSPTFTTPRPCVECGEVFYAMAGWVCAECERELVASAKNWKDPDTYFDAENPGYKIYRIRYWVLNVPDLSVPYDYHGRTGNIKMRDRLMGEYSFRARFPELHKPGVEVEEEVDLVRSFPWSADGRDRAVVAEMIEILESAINPETITMNKQLVPEFTQARNWKTIEAARRQIARQGLG